MALIRLIIMLASFLVLSDLLDSRFDDGFRLRVGYFYRVHFLGVVFAQYFLADPVEIQFVPFAKGFNQAHVFLPYAVVQELVVNPFAMMLCVLRIEAIPV